MGWFSDSKFAFCRGIANHAWQFPPDLSYEGKQLTLTLHCGNCGAARKDRVSAATGAVDGRRYTYADGYKLDFGGEKRPPKDDLRKDGLALLIGQAKVAQLKRPGRTSRKRAA